MICTSGLRVTYRILHNSFADLVYKVTYIVSWGFMVAFDV